MTPKPNQDIWISPPAGTRSMIRASCMKIAFCWAAEPVGRLKTASFIVGSGSAALAGPAPSTGSVPAASMKTSADRVANLGENLRIRMAR
ncbi:hypothetical protein [Plantactinospora veratri]